MDRKYLKVMCIFLLFSVLCHSQNASLRKANKSFSKYNFARAIEFYETAAEQGVDSLQISKNMADSYYMLANYSEAANWYKMFAESNSKSWSAEHTRRYSQSLKATGDYSSAIKLEQEIAQKNGKGTHGLDFSNAEHYLRKIRENSGRGTIENLSINSSASDFAPSFQIEALVFASDRGRAPAKKDIHLWSKKRFLNLYVSPLQETVLKFSDDVNSSVHESSTAFSKDGKTVYFTRNNSNEGSFERDGEGFSRLKIYKAEFKDNRWTNETELPFNSDAFSVAHPALNKKEDKLYFASDMPGTIGESDIYVVDILGDNTYGKPKNLGLIINTPGRETFPFIDEEENLYFASNGHPGLGGLDIFATRLSQPYVVNVGEPINSPNDDFSFCINRISKKGYFASDRQGGKGDDDIYVFSEKDALEIDCYSFLSGVVKNKTTGKSIGNARLEFVNGHGVILQKVRSNEDGSFKFKIGCENEKYDLVANAQEFEKSTIVIQEEGEKNIISDVMLKPILTLDDGLNLITHLEVAPINFDFDDAEITADAILSIDKIISFMHANQTFKIEVQGHTDSQGNNMYNMKLSEKRAKSIADYMVKEGGVATERISHKGYGESKLLIKCPLKASCKEFQHAQNRRSELIVVKELPLKQ